MLGTDIEGYLVKTQTHPSLHAAGPRDELHGIADT